MLTALLLLHHQVLLCLMILTVTAFSCSVPRHLIGPLLLLILTTPSHNDYHQLPTSPSNSCLSSSGDIPLRDSGSYNSPLAPAFSPILSLSSSQSLSTSSDECMPCPGQAMQVKTYKLVGDNIDKTICLDK